jgi:transcription antitermination factor NusG
MDFEPEQRVKVIAGPMMDQEGRVVEVKNKTVKICIDSLGYMLVAHIDKNKLMAVQPPTKS